MNVFGNLSIKGRLTTVVAVLALLSLLIGAMGLFGMSKANDALKTVYEDRAVPLDQLGDIRELMLKNRIRLATTLIDAAQLPGGGMALDRDLVAQNTADIEKYRDEITRLWTAYLATYLTPEEKILAAKFAESRGRFVTEAIAPAVAALRANRYDEAKQIIIGKARPLYEAANVDMTALAHYQVEVAKMETEAAKARYELTRNITIAALSLGLLLAFWLGRSLMAAVLRPLEHAMLVFHQIEQGNYSNQIHVDHKDEIGQVLDALRAMQSKLALDVAESARVAAENLRIKVGLDNVSTSVMIADNDRKIIYMNRAVTNMLKAAQTDLRKTYPGFDPDKLVGGSIDEFHKAPGHQRQMLSTFTATHKTQITIAGHTFALAANPVLNEKGERLGAVVEWDDITERLIAQEHERALAAENLRIKIALDNVATSVMIADNQRNIIYMNPAVVNMLRNAEADVRKVLPTFNVAGLLGANMDQFHINPSHQANLLGSLTSNYKSQISIGPRTFALSASPVIDARGERLGAVVEWQDRTAEVMVETEMSELVKSAIMGDFTRRAKLEGKEGFFKIMAESMNKLLETSETSLDEVVRVLNALARGDLTETIDNEYFGTFGRLKDDSNKTVHNLKNLIEDIKVAVESISTGAREIANGNADLSHRTEEQASSLEETASSMEQLSATVKQNADSALQANQMSMAASQVAAKGGSVVHEVVRTMTDINTSARKIVDIISVIDGIAFQTNILALNAAVEAARAGEQGRGFAVVAAEVRNLAQRSAAAAKEIKTLISDSVDKVEIGADLVNQAGNTMEDIVSSVKRVTDIMAEITAASAEQSSGIEQVNTAITQIDEVTQQNAALVEQAAAAAESLTEQAQTLLQSVSVFKLSATGGSKALALRSPAVLAKPTPTTPIRSAPVKPKSPVKPVKPASDDDEWAEF
ncbi:MAG: PAS domain-containing protein [Methylococcaceae bacterium]|nr:MAG: PAS domain-containing protein [Methylococcaceae bacterium]